MTALFDAHCHLAPKATLTLDNAPSDAVRGAACSGRLLCGVDPTDWKGIETLSGFWKGTVPAFGLHPWHVPPSDTVKNPAPEVSPSSDPNRSEGEYTAAWLNMLEHFLVHTPQSWVGEIGLDARRKGIASREKQETAFIAQLCLAARLKRKVSLHCVGAWEALLSLLEKYYLAAGMRFIVHGFGGPYQMIRLLADRGAYFSVGPLMAGKDSRKMRERAGLFPVDRVILESDAFLFPGVDAVDEIRESVLWLAGVWGVGVDRAMEQANLNTREVMGNE